MLGHGDEMEGAAIQGAWTSEVPCEWAEGEELGRMGTRGRPCT